MELTTDWEEHWKGSVELKTQTNRLTQTEGQRRERLKPQCRVLAASKMARSDVSHA